MLLPEKTRRMGGKTVTTVEVEDPPAKCLCPEIKRVDFQFLPGAGSKGLC